jgi:hypothetical protein
MEAAMTDLEVTLVPHDATFASEAEAKASVLGNLPETFRLVCLYAEPAPDRFPPPPQPDLDACTGREYVEWEAAWEAASNARAAHWDSPQGQEERRKPRRISLLLYGGGKLWRLDLTNHHRAPQQIRRAVFGGKPASTLTLSIETRLHQGPDDWGYPARIVIPGPQPAADETLAVVKLYDDPGIEALLALLQ